MLAFKEIEDNILRYRFNPAAIQQAILRGLTEVNNGEQIYLNATSPALQVMGAAVCTASALFTEHAAENRRRYPLLAQTQEDIYLHMSDDDYLNRFASPAKANFTLRFRKSELINNMVKEPETGYGKLTIPRNSYFKVSDYVFGMQYPIDIRQASHEGLQITYNNDKLSPLQSLESNSIEYDTQSDGVEDWIVFSIEVQQFKIKQQHAPISKSSALSLAMEITDQFYYARVFHKNPSTLVWDELTTTHAANVYDATQPTAVLHVADKVLTVKIPQIYVNNGLLSSNIRVDMYETMGSISVPLADYPGKVTQITWFTTDKTEERNPYSASLSKMNVGAYSTDVVIGGTNEMPFETLRSNVINNAAGPIPQATTEAQLKVKLANAGYDIVKHIDTVTDRVYLATRDMPAPSLVTGTTATSTGRKLLTAAAASIETLLVSTESLAAMPTVVDNGNSITITPNTLYRLVDGVVQVMQQSEVDRLKALPADQQALEVTNGGYLYTPFHYVLDNSTRIFEIRPYYLDKPNASAKVFIKQNDTTLLLTGTASYAIKRTDTGYSLRVVTRSNDAYKAIPDNQVFAQLAFIPKGERERAYINGVFVGVTAKGERVFDFDLSTNYNITSDNLLQLTKFTMFNTESRLTNTPLVGTFDIIYSTSSVQPANWLANDVDKVLGRHLLPLQIAGINHEQVKLNFGTALSRLWSRARTIADSMTYQTYSEDKQAFYQEDVYQFDADGLRLTVVDGELKYTKLHLKGDPILDSEGNITYEYRKGDLKRDIDGKPIPTNIRSLKHQIDLMLLEGAYWFATDETTTNYRKTLTDVVVGWVSSDLESFRGGLLDQTRIYFYPKTTSGVVNVYVWDDVPKTISAGQSLNVTLSVSKAVMDNTSLKERLEAVTISVLSTMLQSKTVSRSKIVKALQESYGDDVIDVEVTGLGGDFDFSVISMANDTDRLSIRKRLVALADGKMAVEEDVNTAFVLHTGT